MQGLAVVHALPLTIVLQRMKSLGCDEARCCAGGVAAEQQAQLMAMMAAGMHRAASATPPPMSHTPPLPAHTPPVPTGTPGPSGPAMQALAANAAALAAAAAGQNGFGSMHPAGMNGGMLGSMEYQAAYQVRRAALGDLCLRPSAMCSATYSGIGLACKDLERGTIWVCCLPQAAYQAALTQQAAAAQSLLMQQQGGGPYGHMGGAPPPGPFPGSHDALAAHVAAQLSMTPGYFNNPNINAAAAAAAAAAVQNLMGAPSVCAVALLCPSVHCIGCTCSGTVHAWGACCLEVHGVHEHSAECIRQQRA